MSQSFTQAVGEWIGQSEVYDASGNFLGHGTDRRNVRSGDSVAPTGPDGGDGHSRVTVDVSFDGPFSLDGWYRIADHGTHRRYEGPLNHGWADPIGDGVVAAHNYWPDLGLSQRFVLMMLPPGDRQLSLALITRGEQLTYVVIGENRRRVEGGSEPPPFAPMAVDELRGDLTGGRGEMLLRRRGTWSGELQLFDADLAPAGSTTLVETITGDETAPDGQMVEVRGLGFSDDAVFTTHHEGTGSFCPTGPVVGSSTCMGGRALSAQLLHQATGRRLWAREVSSADGAVKGVVHLWFEGERRIGAATGRLDFRPEDTTS